MTVSQVFTATLLCLAAQAPKAERDPSAERLQTMKEAVAAYSMTLNSASPNRPVPITVQAEPAFRLGKQGVGNILEGAIYLWLDDVGRPQAAGQIFFHRENNAIGGKWIHELTSLAEGPLSANEHGTVAWAPNEAGLSFKKLEGAPKPAASANARLRQMRALATEFKATDNFGDQGWGNLRLLPTPIARYGKAGGTPEDGALFAFVEGTDPEVFVFIEARDGPNGLEWRFAAAPMSVFALKVEHKGQTVWEVPHRDSESPFKPFHDRVLNP